MVLTHVCCSTQQGLKICYQHQLTNLILCSSMLSSSQHLSPLAAVALPVQKAAD